MLNELFQRSPAQTSMYALSLKLWLPIAACLVTSQTLNASMSTDNIKPFPDATLAGWQEKSFVGNTEYELIEEADTTILRAHANNTASVLYKEDAIDLTATPWLEWSWKIDSIYSQIDEKTQAGDDFPARLYVTAQIGFLPWESIAINYVWSSNQTINTVWESPFTEKSIMVAVQSGQQHQRKWVSQRRNVVDDFKQLFNVDVEQISGYAVMVDGDNASQVGTAYFGNIDFLAD